jgi:hypothetical protein
MEYIILYIVLLLKLCYIYTHIIDVLDYCSLRRILDANIFNSTYYCGVDDYFSIMT